MELSAALEFVRPHHRGVLVTLRRDGRSQLSNIAYAVDDTGTIAISVTDTRAKTHNARRDPRVSLYVTTEDFWSYVVIDGSAELTPVASSPSDSTVEQLVAYYRAVVGEHKDWDDFRQAMVREQRLLLRVRPGSAYGFARS